MNVISHKAAAENLQELLIKTLGSGSHNGMEEMAERILKEGPCVLEALKNNFPMNFDEAYAKIVNNEPYQQYLKEVILSISQKPESTQNQTESFRNSKKKAIVEIKTILLQVFQEDVMERDKRITNLSQKLLEEGLLGLESERKALGENFHQTQIDINRNTSFQNFLKECLFSVNSQPIPQADSNLSSDYSEIRRDLTDQSLDSNVLVDTIPPSSQKKKEDEGNEKEEEEEKILETQVKDESDKKKEEKRKEEEKIFEEIEKKASFLNVPYPYLEESAADLEQSEIDRIVDLLRTAFFDKLKSGEMNFLKKEILEASKKEETLYKILRQALYPVFSSLKQNVEAERDKRMMNENEKTFYSHLCGELAYYAGFALNEWAGDQ